MTSGFAVEKTEALIVEASPPLSEMYMLSPFVREGNGYWDILLRAVPRRDDEPALKIASIYHGTSENGLRFFMDLYPSIAPGPEAEDLDGCEDPTVVDWQGWCFVYYTGWNQSRQQGSLMLATGTNPSNLTKDGIRLASSDQFRNPKEATVVSVADGTWRLFFEYAEGGASKIGVASAPSVEGPWTIGSPLLEARPGHWDAWHLSTGPMLQSDPTRPVMFYNGATQDAHWRIGWVMFDAQYTRVVDRCDAPLIVPPAPQGDRTDIAFAASAVEANGAIFLYYSIADQDMMRAALCHSR